MTASKMCITCELAWAVCTHQIRLFVFKIFLKGNNRYEYIGVPALVVRYNMHHR